MKLTILPLLLLSLTSCASQAQLDAAHDYAQAVLTATDPSSPGGTSLSLDEKAVIQEKYAKLAEAPGIDWESVGVAVVGTLGAIFPLLRLLPNKHVIGKTEALALDKLAGTGPAPEKS